MTLDEAIYMVDYLNKRTRGQWWRWWRWDGYNRWLQVEAIYCQLLESEVGEGKDDG